MSYYNKNTRIDTDTFGDIDYEFDVFNTNPNTTNTYIDPVLTKQMDADTFFPIFRRIIDQIVMEYNITPAYDFFSLYSATVFGCPNVSKSGKRYVIREALNSLCDSVSVLGYEMNVDNLSDDNGEYYYMDMEFGNIGMANNRKGIIVFNAVYPFIILGASKNDVINNMIYLRHVEAARNNYDPSAFVNTFQMMLDQTVNANVSDESLYKYREVKLDLQGNVCPAIPNTPEYIPERQRVILLTEYNLKKFLMYCIFGPYALKTGYTASRYVVTNTDRVNSINLSDCWSSSKDALEHISMMRNLAANPNLVPTDESHDGNIRPQMIPTYTMNGVPNPSKHVINNMATTQIKQNNQVQLSTATTATQNQPALADAQQNEKPAETNDSETNANTTEASNSAADNNTKTETTKPANEKPAPAPASGSSLMGNPKMMAKRMANAAKAKEEANK